MKPRNFHQFLLIIFYIKHAYTQNSVYDSSELSLSYTDNLDSTDFVITSKSGVTTNVYYSFGLSNDMNMVN